LWTDGPNGLESRVIPDKHKTSLTTLWLLRRNVVSRIFRGVWLLHGVLDWMIGFIDTLYIHGSGLQAL
jgi:hypothetical protein